MRLFKQARKLIKQFIKNLWAENWIYRHVEDQEPDYPRLPAETLPGAHISSLSLALNQMGILRTRG